MIRTMDQITLVDIIWADARHHELMDQRLHDAQVVVNTFQQDALVAERHTMIHQPFKSCPHLSRDLFGMIHVDAHPERMEFLKHLAEFGCNALRQKHRNSTANTNKLDMFD